MNVINDGVLLLLLLLSSKIQHKMIGDDDPLSISVLTLNGTSSLQKKV